MANGKWLTLEALRDETGWTDDKINGLVRRGKMKKQTRNKKTTFYFEELPEGEESLEEAKRRKMVADANLAELKEPAMRRQLFMEWSQLFLEAYSDSFAEYNNLVAKMRLDKDCTKKLNEVFSLCLAKLSDRLKSTTNIESS